MNLPQLFAEGNEVLYGECLLWIFDGLDEGQRGKTRTLDVGKIDRGGGPAEVGDTSGQRRDKCRMALRGRPLLQLVERHMNVLQPFVGFLNKEVDQLLLKFIRRIARHESSPSQQSRFGVNRRII